MAKQQEEPRALVPVDTLAAPRLPVTERFLSQIELTTYEWRTLTDAVFASARSVEAVALAVSYCRSRNLDVLKRPVHIVPMYSSLLKRYVETVWPGIAELRTTAARTGAYAGCDKAVFGPAVERTFIDQIEDERDARNNRDQKYELKYPEWCDVTTWRIVQGVRCAFVGSAIWIESYATIRRNSDCPNDMWRRRSYSQLEKCAEAQSLRRGFPEEIGGEYAAEEMAGKVIDHDNQEIMKHVAMPPRPTRPPPPKAKPAADNPATDSGKPTGDSGKATGDPVNSNADPDNKIVDVEVEEIGDDGVSGMSEEDTAYLERLEQSLQDATDEATVDAVWKDFNPEGRFERDKSLLSIADGIRKFRVSVIASGGRR